ncbi:putative bifunctional diguanylate cyclase/phosphodiesterase [Antrihabitans cavernicola]|uniref:EAL domain-containing protein n=1 Tax=Antrihabitans cavernicola TaxID=2495913 RepID=A0A5A7S9W6_9NOCA|nr:EAL domain-containing protein [Spelaeibacter cavernicola]KAA0021627.1 EAL domain-containing protein [Spelaeibacter cavernicola]
MSSGIHTVDTERFVGEWATAIEGHQVPIHGSELARYLDAATTRLASELHAEEPDSAVAQGIGAELVADGFTSPRVLGTSVELFTSRFDELSGCRALECRPIEERRAHLARLVGALTVGYCAALRDLLVEVERGVHQALDASEVRAQKIFDESPTGISITTIGGQIVDTNVALQKMFQGVTAKPDVRDFSTPDDPPGVWTRHDEVISGRRSHARGEWRVTRDDGTELWTDVTVSLIRNGDVDPLVLYLVNDITDQHRWQQALLLQANFDQLTELPNRAQFLRKLTGFLAHAGRADRVGLCYFDLDGFKEINDSFGHPVGDRVLVEIADRVRAAMKSEGHCAARLGGDEFAILVENPADAHVVSAIAERILKAVSAPFRIGEHRLRLSSSIGVVERSALGTTADELLTDADTTLYWAKEQGKGCWVLFDASMRAERTRNATLARDLRVAIVDKGALVLHYQPEFDLRTGRILGVEALIRWAHPQLGLLQPGEFLTASDTANLAPALDRWVLATAFRQIAAWQADFDAPDLVVRVNVSAAHLITVDFVDTVIAAIAEAGARPDSVCLEVPEHSILGDDARSTANLYALRDNGIQVAIDDFGTGYSSLARLKALPVNALKIDRGFVHDLGASQNDLAIVTSIIGLANSFDLEVIAEGVETAVAAATLTDLGCHRAQGFLFSKPIPADQMGELLRAERAKDKCGGAD